MLGWPLLWPHYLSCVTALVISIDHIRCSLSRNEKENVMHHSNTPTARLLAPRGEPIKVILFNLGTYCKAEEYYIRTTAVHLCAPPFYSTLSESTDIHPSVHEPELVSSATETVQTHVTHTHAHSQHKVNTHINHTCNIISINTGDE